MKPVNSVPGSSGANREIVAMTTRSIVFALTAASASALLLIAAAGAQARPRVIDHTGPQVITGGWERNWRITTSPHQFNPCCRERVIDHRGHPGKPPKTKGVPAVHVPPPAR
jgi:hypothetical protein